MSMHGNLPVKTSVSGMKRWLSNSSVLINGKKPGPNDPVEYPIEQLIFFPKNPASRCTMVDYLDNRSFFADKRA